MLIFIFLKFFVYLESRKLVSNKISFNKVMLHITLLKNFDSSIKFGLELFSKYNIKTGSIDRLL